MSNARRRIPLLVSVLVVVAGMMMASPAWAVLVKAADWQMNETEGQMRDLSGNGNNGNPTNVVQGVKEDVDGDGVVEADESTYLFNGSITNPSRVAVPDADSLDPEGKNITLTARVKVNGESMDDDSYDVVRKGLVTTEGGDYKMEIKRTADPTVGKLHCFFRGDQASVKKIANRDIVDGNWHILQCEKTSDKVVARVDGGRSFKSTGSAGSIANLSNVMVGAKQVTLTSSGAEKGDDVFDGWMDFVSIEIAQ